MRKCLNWETSLSKEVYRNSNVTQTGVWGRSPMPPEAMESGAKSPDAGQFFVIFWKKKAILIPLDHISHVFIAF